MVVFKNTWKARDKNWQRFPKSYQNRTGSTKFHQKPHILSMPLTTLRWFAKQLGTFDIVQGVRLKTMCSLKKKGRKIFLVFVDSCGDICKSLVFVVYGNAG